VPVDGIFAGIEDASRKPLHEWQVGCIKNPVILTRPRDIFCRLSPELLRVTERSGIYFVISGIRNARPSLSCYNMADLSPFP